MIGKLTLLLSNKDAIAELAKDPEVQIKIKDAIIDGAIRRCAKTENGIANMIAEKLRKELTDSSMWCMRLNDECVKLIKDEAKAAVGSFVRSEVNTLIEEARKHINYHKALTMAKLEEINMDKIIREEVRKAVNEKFK